MKHIWRDGIMGVVVGDALGCPVQFESREDVAAHPVTGMRGYGTFNLPEGSWTDDSSLTLALLDSLNKKDSIDLTDIMRNFIAWLDFGEYTPYGYSYDIGRGTANGINRYKRIHDPYNCGGTEENNNGNGSLMRIMPICLYCYEKGYDDETAIKHIHDVSGLTHAHIRSKIACGFYYFMVKAVIEDDGALTKRLQHGIIHGFNYYMKHLDLETYKKEMDYFDRLYDLSEFTQVSENKIKSSGYVVDSLEASVWSLITTSNAVEAYLKAVNLGDDTDTVGAITGGLIGLFYGFNAIPNGWVDAIQKKDWILDMCEVADERLNKHMFTAQ